jgi:hypothetical protein
MWISGKERFCVGLARLKARVCTCYEMYVELVVQVQGDA